MISRELSYQISEDEYFELLQAEVDEFDRRIEEGESEEIITQEVKELHKEHKYYKTFILPEVRRREAAQAASIQDKQRPTASTVTIDTQANADRHKSQSDEAEPEEDEWSEDECSDDESSDGEYDAENVEKLLREAYMEYHNISPESVVQVIDPDNTLIQTKLVTLGNSLMVCKTSTNNDDPAALEGDDQYFTSTVSTDTQTNVDRQPSEYCTLQLTACEEQSENEVITNEEIHKLILIAAEEGAKVRKMGAQRCIEIEELEIPLPESIGMYDKLIENLKSEMLCSEESCVETPDFIKDIYNIIDESEKSATLRAIRLKTRYDEIEKDLNDLKCFLDSEEKLAAYEESIRLFDYSNLESRFNLDEILEEIGNSKAVIESVTENNLFYEVIGDKVDYLIDPTKTTIDFVCSPDSFYPHMHQPHLKGFRIELENVASAYYNCLLAMLWNFVCLVVCLFACNDRRRTKGALAQPFDSCD